MHARARTLSADAIILDLEDGVAEAHKERAREQIPQSLQEGFPPDLPVFVRPNSQESGLLEGDLRAVLHPRVTGVVLPKVRTAGEVRDIVAWLRLQEAGHGIEEGALRLLILIESPPAVLGALEIARASPRVVGLAFGADDLAAAMGLARTAAPADVSYPRAHVALAAHAAGVDAIDIVHTAVKDREGFRREAETARALGYTGKQVVHPAQVDLANEIFAPSAEEVAWARATTAAFAAAPRGVMMVEGKMVDAPVIRQARRILERAARVAARRAGPSSSL